MIIGDKRFAAAFVNEQGEYFKFDDIGCMKAYENKNKITPRNSWVHDFRSEGWITRNLAIFIHSKELVTPMGYGLAAFTKGVVVDQFLSKEGERKISWDEMSEILQRNNH